MQPPFHFSRRAVAANLALAVVLGVVAGGGCRPPRLRDPIKPLPFAGVTVRLACGDAGYAKELVGRGKIWGTRTGGTVVLEPDWTTADAAVLPPARLGEMAVADVLAARPAALADREHPLKWAEVLPAFQDKLCNWGRRPFAVPVAGDGFVLIYRVDRFADPKAADAFRAKYQRELAPPPTWEDLRTVADLFATLDGKPSLPPLPADPTATAVAFNQVAACYDRAAVSSAAAPPTGTVPPPEEPASDGTAFRFHVDPDTAAPRLTAPSFVAAFGWFHDTAKYRPATGDPRDAVVNGSAVAAVLSLAEVAKLPKGADGAVDRRFGVAPVPGSAVWYGADGKPRPASGGRNYVPYLGAGGQLGVVFKRTAVAEAAWDFLADLAGPTGADDTLGEVTLGAGPFRYSHVAISETAAKWQRYGFDAARTEQLSRAVGAFADVQLREPVYPLRTPDHAEREAILAAAVRKAAAGALPADKAAAEAQAAWQAVDAKLPPTDRRREARNAVGLE